MAHASSLMYALLWERALAVPLQVRLGAPLGTQAVDATHTLSSRLHATLCFGGMNGFCCPGAYSVESSLRRRTMQTLPSGFSRTAGIPLRSRTGTAASWLQAAPILIKAQGTACGCSIVVGVAGWLSHHPMPGCQASELRGRLQQAFPGFVEVLHVAGDSHHALHLTSGGEGLLQGPALGVL